jgi:hypothetical protein
VSKTAGCCCCCCCLLAPVAPWETAGDAATNQTTPSTCSQPPLPA